jgi:hypothetical protein
MKSSDLHENFLTYYEIRLLKSCSLGVRRGHNMGNYFTVVSMGEGGG